MFIKLKSSFAFPSLSTRLPSTSINAKYLDTNFFKLLF